ncbi:MAG: ABC transporter permease subunit [Vallitalea sp.]|nr:ABC transporter permease subunit [Vallitalea sp.]
MDDTIMNGICQSKKQNQFIKQLKEYKYIYMLLIPGMVFFFLFHYMPLYGVTLAFKDFIITKGISGSPWVGFKYFEQIFTDKKFWDVTFNTLHISLGRLIFEFPIPIILAILINELISKRFKKVVQSLLYFPFFISWIIMYALLQNVFSVDGGIINGILQYFGMNTVNFLTETSWFRPIVYMSNTWKMAGYSTILYLAAITNIDQQLYEAAYVDGANRFRRIWHITLPGMQTIILTVLILCVGNMMNGGFDQIVNIYNQVVYSVADILDTYVYRQAMERGQFSLATAIGLFKAFINLILLLIVDRISRKIKGVGIYE